MATPSLKSCHGASKGKKPGSRTGTPVRGLPVRVAKHEPELIEARPSPPMFQSSNRSSSGVSSLSLDKPTLPPITLVYEGRGGTFYYGSDAQERDIAHERGNARDLKDTTNKSSAAGQSRKNTDYFLVTRAIGTEGLHSCVALFFTIGSDKLFFAHIDISKAGTARLVDLNSEDAAQASNAVYTRIRDKSRDEGWSSDDVGRESVRVICPKKGSKSAGAVLDAMARFLNLPKDPSGGFVTVSKDNIQRPVSIDEYGGCVFEDGQFRRRLTYLGSLAGSYVLSSGHSNLISQDTWRYVINRGWGIAPTAATKG